MGVDVSASGTFHSVRLQILPKQKRLHFSQFQRAQHPAQAGNASSVAARLTPAPVDKFAPAIALPSLDNLLRVIADLVFANVAHVRMKAANQCLTHVGMQLRLQQRNR